MGRTLALSAALALIVALTLLTVFVMVHDGIDILVVLSLVILGVIGFGVIGALREQLPPDD